jgi:hypothetical protein
MTDLSGMERRLTLRLIAYWERVRGERLMPSESDIDPDDLHDLWDYCFLVQVRDLIKEDYNYTYLGSAIVDAYRAGLSMSDPGRLVAPSANKLTISYQQVINTRAPVIEEGEFNNLRGDRVKYRQCMLPLSYGEAVDAIFGGMRFKIFPA